MSEMYVKGEDMPDLYGGQVGTAEESAQSGTPEQVMWTAFLSRMLNDMAGLDRAGILKCDCDYPLKPGPKRKELHHPPPHTLQVCAKEWLADDGSNEVGSFLWVCDVLKHEPGYVRRLAKRAGLETSSAGRRLAEV